MYHGQVSPSCRPVRCNGMLYGGARVEEPKASRRNDGRKANGLVPRNSRRGDARSGLAFGVFATSEADPHVEADG